MADVSGKGLHGRFLRITRGPSGRLWSRNGFMGTALYLGSEGSEALVDIEGWTTATSITTSSTTVTVRGIGLVSSSSGVWSWSTSPTSNVEKRFFATSTSTLVRQIGSTNINYEVGVIASSAALTTAGSSFCFLTFNGQGQSVTLLGYSSTKWVVTSVAGFSTTHQPFTTV